jgi:hypothetical protein
MPNFKINYDDIYNKIKTHNKTNDLLYLKTISTTNYNKILKCIEHTISNTNSIIKGSRSLYNTLRTKLISKEDYLFKDYDLYCLEEQKDNFISILTETLKKYKMENIIHIENNPVYNNIIIISFYGDKFIDLQLINNNKYNIIPKININNLYYLSPEFMKLDIYNIISTPILFNLLSVEKFINRIKHIEEQYKYKYNYDILKKIDNNYNIIKSLLNFKSNCIITGLLAFKMLYNYNINIPYLEIFSSNPDLEIKNLKTIIPFQKIETISGIDYSTEKIYILYHNDKPMVYIYKLLDCKSYFIKNNKLISTNPGLLYYFHNCIYINKLYNSLNNINIYNYKNIIYSTILHILYKKLNLKIISKCTGDIQPVIIRSKNIKKNKE